MVFDSARFDLRPYTGFAMDRHVRRFPAAHRKPALGLPQFLTGAPQSRAWAGHGWPL